MKDNSFWDTISSYIKFRTIVPAIILIIVAVVFIAKAIFDKL